jgi:hypothetical protein
VRTFTAITLLFFTSVSLAALPDWVKPRAKEMTIDDFISTMSTEPFTYRITNVTVEDSVFNSGEESVLVTVHFDDSRSCTARRFIHNCTPLTNEGPLLCFVAYTDCNGEVH